MMRVIEYKNLETSVHDGANIRIGFNPKDKIKLRRGIQEGKHVVEIVTPQGNIYYLGKYESEEEAKRAFEECDARLEYGGKLRIISNTTMEIDYR